ncbi:MAG: YdiU family protein [Acidimicrobiales bacterium]
MIDELTTSLARLRFDNRFTRELPADPEVGGRTRPVSRAAYSRVQPVTVPAPRIIAWSPEMSAQLGLDDDVWTSAEAAEVFSGNRLLPGSDPHAANYGGHQFGQWAGQLGDGRAIALGEVIDRDGNHQTLQLKGAGPTPYSRRADGLAVLRSSIREFLCSEAMHHLGVPTTRALSLALTGNEVMRDMLYDGNPRLEPGAVVCRVAPSFIRFGNFQLFAARNEIEELRLLADFTIRHHFAHLLPPGAPAGDAVTPEVYAAWFAEVCRLSAAMVVEWMRVGFVHGVMNTDNMSIHGLTIDYGPYGWLDDYDPEWTPNTTDAAGRRYRFGHQPAVVQWNLLQLANAVYPLVGEAAPLEEALNGFGEDYTGRYRAMLRAKLGLVTDRGDDDDPLLHGLLEVLRATETDMTIFHRRLGELPVAELARLGAEPGALDAPGALGDAWYTPHAVPAEARAGIAAWLTDYAVRLVEEARPDGERRAAMERVNPHYVLRNYLAQEAIDAAEQGDASLIGKLAEVLRRPYEVQAGMERFAAKRPDWARSRPGCSMLSCSS